MRWYIFLILGVCILPFVNASLFVRDNFILIGSGNGSGNSSTIINNTYYFNTTINNTIIINNTINSSVNATPGGSNTQLQFNDVGSFAGAGNSNLTNSSGLYWDKFLNKFFFSGLFTHESTTTFYSNPSDPSNEVLSLVYGQADGYANNGYTQGRVVYGYKNTPNGTIFSYLNTSQVTTDNGGSDDVYYVEVTVDNPVSNDGVLVLCLDTANDFNYDFGYFQSGSGALTLIDDNGNNYHACGEATDFQLDLHNNTYTVVSETQGKAGDIRGDVNLTGGLNVSENVVVNKTVFSQSIITNSINAYVGVYLTSLSTPLLYLTSGIIDTVGTNFKVQSNGVQILLANATTFSAVGGSALSPGSFSVGIGASSSSPNCVSLGFGTLCSLDNGVSIGYTQKTTASNCVGIGSGLCNGTTGVAIGNPTMNAQTGIGMGNAIVNASATSSIGIGTNVKVDGVNGVVIGSGANGGSLCENKFGTSLMMCFGSAVYAMFIDATNFNISSTNSNLKNVYPIANNTYVLGNSSLQWSQLYSRNINFSNAFGEKINLTFNGEGQPISFVGNATVWNDIVSPFTAVKVPASNAPVWSEGNMSYYFEDKATMATEEYAFVSVQMPHGYREGSNIECHIHVVPDLAQKNNVTFNLSYTWTNINAVTASPTFITVSYNFTSGVAYNNTVLSFGNISGSGKTISSILNGKLKRTSSVASDSFTGNVFVNSFDCHYEEDTLGSASQYGKWS